MKSRIIKYISCIVIFLVVVLVATFKNSGQVYRFVTSLSDYDIYNSEYVLIVDIPKIKLRKGLFSKDSSQNDLNKNIQILKESDMPDKENGIFILAAHSGNNYNAFFRDVHKLQIEDKIYIYYKKIKYTYKIYNIYDIEKTGKAEVMSDKESTIITLITCIPNTNRQLVVMGNLISKEKYDS